MKNAGTRLTTYMTSYPRWQ